MKWHKTEENDFPPLNEDGLSDYMLVTLGKGCLPEIAQYKPSGFNFKYRGTNKKSLWITNRNEPTIGEPRFWAKIKIPKD